MEEEKKTKKTTNTKSTNGTKKTKSTTTSKKKTNTSTSAKKTPTKSSQTKKKVTPKKVMKSVEPERTKEVKKEGSVVVEEKKEQVASFEKQYTLGVVTVVLVAILAIVGVVAVYYRAKENAYSVDWEEKSFLVENEIASTNCETVSNAILGDYSFIFVREKTSNEEEFNLEKKLKKIIEDYDLENHFYVYTLDNECGVISDPYSVLGQNLSLNEGIMKVPTILYYKDGKLVDSIEREDELMMSDADFVHLLDIYEFEK